MSTEFENGGGECPCEGRFGPCTFNQRPRRSFWRWLLRLVHIDYNS